MWTQFRRRNRFEGFVWPESASSQPFRGFCVTRVSIVATVSRVLCDPSQCRRNRFDGFVWPESASSQPFRRFCHDVVSPKFNRTCVGAYRIRPDVGENEMITTNIIPPSNMQPRRHGGRMRYAPTVFGSKQSQHDGQTNRFDANMKHTTPSNESRRTFK